MRIRNRILTACVLLAICGGALAGYYDLPAKAAPSGEVITSITTTSGSAVSSLTLGRLYNIEFEYYDATLDSMASTPSVTLKSPSFSTHTGSAFQKGPGSTITIKLEEDVPGSGIAVVHVKLENVPYKKLNYTTLKLDLSGTVDTVTPNYSHTVTGLALSIGDYLGSSGNNGNSGSSSDGDDYVSDIVVEKVVVRDSSGTVIHRVDEDSDPFTVEVYFFDLGFEGVHQDDFYDRNLAAYITAPGGFAPMGSNKGTLAVTTLSSSDDFPRFKATFTNLTYDGGSNTMTLRLQYYVDSYIYGETSATVYQAQPKKEEDEDEDKIDPATPYIILSQYSYGSDPIEAGTEFRLDMSFLNTSTETPLENIVMKVTTPDDLSIASSSNSYYFDFLDADAVLTQSIALLAKPSATVGSHAVEIEFAYQYIVDKERREKTTNFNVAIPVTQIDRFEVDPLTEYQDYANVGEETYLTVSFINRGKSTTYNVSGSLRGAFTSAGQSQHYGNVEPGKSGTLDFSVVCDTPGVIDGEILIQYEDENTRQKELTVPFSITVEEANYPDYGGETEEPEEPEDTGSAVFTAVLCSLGGLLTATPIALIVIKWRMAKREEDFDEDF